MYLRCLIDHGNLDNLVSHYRAFATGLIIGNEVGKHEQCLTITDIVKVLPL